MSISSDIAVRAEGLTKVYRLYARQRYRLLDILGVLPKSASTFREHKALDRVSLEIARGEKVAIIGRNGAGKSTLMKLVSRVIQPTSGTLEVRARVNALLQIGTGFHPDFTGRQNVYAYLAQVGVSGVRADRLFEEVVEFAELEEYIDQPVKTYSTGMGVRLMFSTSTAVEPDLLLLDEVLGVGDAYFAQKSFDRIRHLSTSRGTTLMLVTHDIYTASRLCDRMIWIDRGQVVLDGSGPAVIRAYEDSIRVQEEHRLRVRRLSAMRALQHAGGGDPDVVPLLVEIAAVQNVPQAAPVYFSAVDLRRDGRVIAALPLDRDGSTQSGSALQLESTAWGSPGPWQGETARPMNNYGSPFHRVAGVLAIPRTDLAGTASTRLHVRYWSAQAPALELRAFSGSWAADLGRLPGASGGWVDHDVEVHIDEEPETAYVPNPNAVGTFGTGDIRITAVAFVDPSGSQVDVLHYGASATLTVGYEILKPALAERAQVIVVLHRDGVQDVCRLMTRDLMFDSKRPAGTVRLVLPQLDLTDGRYSVTVMIAAPGYYDTHQTTFFAIHPGVYSCVSRAFDVKVVGAGTIGEGTIVVKQGEWSIQ